MSAELRGVWLRGPRLLLRAARGEVVAGARRTRPRVDPTRRLAGVRDDGFALIVARRVPLRTAGVDTRGRRRAKGAAGGAEAGASCTPAGSRIAGGGGGGGVLGRATDTWLGSDDGGGVDDVSAASASGRSQPPVWLSSGGVTSAPDRSASARVGCRIGATGVNVEATGGVVACASAKCAPRGAMLEAGAGDSALFPPCPSCCGRNCTPRSGCTTQSATAGGDGGDRGDTVPRMRDVVPPGPACTFGAWPSPSPLRA